MRSSKFWALLLVFQLVFGISVFAVTRYIYTSDSSVAKGPSGADLQPPIDWTDTASGFNTTLLDSLGSVATESSDPMEISRQADVLFTNKQYAKAAELYEKLLDFGPGNADVHNNLGLTLQYLGRSDEALRRLDEGVKLDPANQRIWLTIGYVNSQAGNTSAARAALETAIQIDSESSIGKSASSMLESLP